MIVCGLDPGSQKTGFAVLSCERGKVEIMEAGAWRLIASSERPPLGDRLERLHGFASELFAKWNPRLIGLEKAVAFKNISSALVLAEARGALRLAAHQSLDRAGDRLIELSPTAVKKAATGGGQSNKAAVERVLSLRFPQLAQMDRSSWPHDAYDALAIAWTAWVDFKRPKL